MLEDRIYPCNINGKYYFEPVDFDELYKNQFENIIKNLEKICNDINNQVYNDEGFKQYINSIKNKDINAVLNPTIPLYKNLFDRTVLEYGSYEFVTRFFEGLSQEKLEEYFVNLDNKIEILQEGLQFYCDNFNYDEILKYMFNNKDRYLNFLENFAPQRLSSYTTSPKNINILYGFKNMERLALKPSIAMLDSSFFNKLLNFNSVYLIDFILGSLTLHMKKYETYQNYKISTDSSERNKIMQEFQTISILIDDITKKGVCASGNLKALINLALSNSFGTFNKIIDGLAIRLGRYNYDERINISDDFNQLLDLVKSMIDDYKNCGKLDIIYNNSTTFQKLLQLSSLDILPDKEKKMLNDFLENYVGTKNIENIDMNSFDYKIDNQEKFSSEDVKEFYNSVMLITAKEKEMPIKYIEFLVSKIVEGDQDFLENLDWEKRYIILENFARIKSKEVAGNKTYITFSINSNDFPSISKDNITVGNSFPGFIKMKPFISKHVDMCVVLSVITMFHELRHQEIFNMMNENKNNHISYIVKKEEFFRMKNLDFYNKNYDSLLSEIDAEYFALNKAEKFFVSLPLSQDFKNSDNWGIILGEINKRRKKIEGNFLNGKNKKFDDGKVESLENAFDEYVLANPSILEKEPIFKVEYNDDGTKKSLKQIFEDFIDIMRIKKNRLGNYDLYKYILFYRTGQSQDISELRDIEIPTDLTYSNRVALEKIREIILAREERVATPIDKEDFVKTGEIDENADEIVNEQAQRKYEDFFGNNERE